MPTLFWLRDGPIWSGEALPGLGAPARRPAADQSSSRSHIPQPFGPVERDSALSQIGTLRSSGLANDGGSSHDGLDTSMNNQMFLVKSKSFAALLALAGGLLISCGCHTTSSPASFASVVIAGNTPGQIRDAAVEVFIVNGYTVTRNDPDNLVFEKKASRMSNFAYGSWMGDEPVWTRVKAAVVPLGDMKCRLQCRAYLVRDRGGATEEEITVSKLHKGQYQKLLDDVASKFASR